MVFLMTALFLVLSNVSIVLANTNLGTKFTNSCSGKGDVETVKKRFKDIRDRMITLKTEEELLVDLCSQEDVVSNPTRYPKLLAQITAFSLAAHQVRKGYDQAIRAIQTVSSSSDTCTSAKQDIVKKLRSIRKRLGNSLAAKTKNCTDKLQAH